jgi:hypothetical protein
LNNGFSEPAGLSAFPRVGRTELICRIFRVLGREDSDGLLSFVTSDRDFLVCERDRVEGNASRGHGPDDACELVGHGDGGAVSPAPSLDV